MQRIRGLDSLRFVLALFVVLSHFGTPGLFGPRIGALMNASVNGVAAVMGFFVISGFCIHYPFRAAKPAHWPGYFIRRYLRIGLPMLAAMAICKPLGVAISPFEEGVFWSLYAEIMYYTIYPALMAARRAFGWNAVLAGSFAAAFGVVLSDPGMLPYHGHGPYLTWIVGLPVWLLGCRLAERVDGPAREVSASRIWAWRGAVWFVGAAAMALRYHSPIGFPITLTLFAPLAAAWIGLEIDHFKAVEPPRLLESAGCWSYSLYLMHMPARAVASRLGLPLENGAGAWFVVFASALLGAYLFYRLVEQPSHHLAKSAERMLKGVRGANSVPSVVPATSKG